MIRDSLLRCHICGWMRNILRQFILDNFFDATMKEADSRRELWRHSSSEQRYLYHLHKREPKIFSEQFTSILQLKTILEKNIRKLNSHKTLKRLFLFSLKRFALFFFPLWRDLINLWKSPKKKLPSVQCPFSWTKYRASRREIMHCPWSACGPAQLDNKICLQC